MNRLYSTLVIPVIAAGLECGVGGTGPRVAPASIKILGQNPFYWEIDAGTIALSASVFDSSGVLINSQVRIAWSSTDTTVVQVDQSGVLTPRKVGGSTIRAAVDANGARVQDSIAVDVFPPGVPVDRAPSAKKAP